MKSITKTELDELPIASFDGRIITIDTESEVVKAIAYLSQFERIGFDTETRPSFKKGKTHEIALLQLSTIDTCFLIRLNKIGFVPCILDFLANPRIRKIGLSLKDDFSTIRRSLKGFEFGGFVELQSFVKTYGIEDNGLRRIYAILFGEKISKRQRLTNWEADILSDSQKKYAALDAFACLKIYNELTQNHSLQ